MNKLREKTEWIHYRNHFEKELHNILAYWMKYGVEKEGEGFYGAVDLQNRPVAGVDKASVLNARILWTFSAAAKTWPGRGYEEMAHRAYAIVTRRFLDPEFGGYYMSLTADNKPKEEIKHTYAQAFVLYSLAKYYEFSGEEMVLDLIRDFFFFLDQKSKDPDFPGYLEAFTRDWKPYQENRMADNNEPKSMNTHLHVLEAYAAVYKVWKEEKVQIRLTELLHLFTDVIIRENGHLGIFFSNEFHETEPSKGICSFGHDIEASWLIWEAAEILGEKQTMGKVKPLMKHMADAVLREGVDKDGGLFLESTRFGSHVRTNKHWWLQAENLVGFMNAFQLHGDRVYWDTVKLSWDFIDKHVIDPVGGEWFTKVNRLGVPFLMEPEDDPSPYYRNDWKIDPWKCPYHNGRAMMELIKRIDLITGNTSL
jgi:mannobiose 2-epimerase